LLGLALAAVTVGFLRVNPFSDKTTVTAMFHDARGVARAGLKTTTEVRLAGAKVGDVARIERVGDHALFTLEIDPGAARALRSDAQAELRPRTPFEGNSYIDLEAGRAAARLEGTIPLAHTRNYVSLYEALSFARGPVRADLRKIIEKLRVTLRPAAQRGIQGALAGMPALSRHLAQGAPALAGPNGDTLAGVVAAANGTMGAVAAEQRSLTPFLDHAARSFAGFDVDQGRALDAALRVSPGSLRQLAAGSQALSGILERLDPLARQLVPGMRELGPTLTAARPLLRTGSSALHRGAPLVGELRGALDGLRKAAPATRRLLRATEPTSDVLNSSLLDALHRKTPVGLPAYLAVINTLQGASSAFSSFQTTEQGRQPAQIGYGHFVNFEGRFYTGYATPELPACKLFALISQNLAEQLGRAGVCRR
jgi:ABC-type transporter Mla subunit MlaD